MCGKKCGEATESPHFLPPAQKRRRRLSQRSPSKSDEAASGQLRILQFEDESDCRPVVGDDNVGVCGPFENAYYTFCRGGVIPLVIGAYGETNEDFQDVLKVCARVAVARGDAVYNSPIFETEVKGGAYSLSPCISITEQLPKPLLEAFPCTRDRGYISYVVREMRQLGSLKRQRFILRLAAALVVMDSRLFTRVENMATMSNLEVLTWPHEQFRGSRSGPERYYE